MRLKLVLVERLFRLSRDKLMKIPAFAWTYARFQQAKAWSEATGAWRTIRALGRAARNYVARIKATIWCHFATVEGDRDRS